jgi:hypothetical protein
VFAPDDRGHNVVDALSAALIIKDAKTAREIRLNSVAKDLTVKEMDFHSTSFHGARNEFPFVGQLVELHLNDDQRLVAVWYAQRKAS